MITTILYQLMSWMSLSLWVSFLERGFLFGSRHYSFIPKHTHCCIMPNSTLRCPSDCTCMAATCTLRCPSDCSCMAATCTLRCPSDGLHVYGCHVQLMFLMVTFHSSLFFISYQTIVLSNYSVRSVNMFEC